MKWSDILRGHRKKIRPRLINAAVAILLFATLMPFPPTMPSDAFATTTSPQSEIMALYLYNFLLFVEWPQETFQENGTLRVIILGNHALFESLKPMRGKLIKGKKLIVINVVEEKEIKEPYHVLFIDSSKKILVPRLLKRVGNCPLLTISNIKEFIDMGGMVLFQDCLESPIEEGQQKRFEINIAAVEKTGLKIGARLLRLSRIVQKKDGR